LRGPSQFGKRSTSADERGLCAARLLAVALAIALGAAAPAEAGPCVRACSGGTLQTADLVVAVGVALGGTPLDACPPLDANADGAVTVDDLVEGVVDLRHACPGGTDRDGNGLNDGEECGDDPAWCVDSDADGLADYEDADDDGDGVPDVEDGERTKPLPEADPLADDPLVAFEARLDVDADGVPPDVGRVGDALVVRGLGFDPTPAGNLVVFEGDAPVAVLPLMASATELTVLVPEGAGPVLRVVRGARRSPPLPVEILARGAPVLFRRIDRDTDPAATLELRGLDLAGVTSVEFAGASAPPSSTEATVLEVTVPAEARSGDVAVRTASLRSNTAPLRVTQTVAVEVVLPPGAAIAATDLVASAGMEAGTPLDGEGRAQVRTSRSGLDLVTVARGGGDTPRPYLQAIALPGDTEVRVDALSTAIVMMVGATGLVAAAEEASVDQARSQLAALSAVQALADEIAQGLAADPDFLVNPPPAFDAQYLAALDAGNDVLAAALASSDAAQAGLQANEGGAAQQATLKATIEPTGGGDCPPASLPACSEQVDVLLRQIEGTGNVAIENDTMVYLSVAIREAAGGQSLQAHARHWFDNRIVGSQEGLLWGFSAADREYRVPNYRSARVDVVTGGLGAPNPPSGDLDVNVVLATRTLFDRILLPAITTAIGAALEKRNPAKDAHLLAKTVLNTMADRYPDDEQAIQDYLRNRNAAAAIGLLVAVLKTDLTNIGPITQAIGRWAAGTVDDVVVRALGIRIATALIPVVGGIAAVAEAIGTAATVTDAVKALVDIIQMPSYLRFDVFFRMTVIEIRPTSIERQPEPRVIDIRGFALALPGGPRPLVTFVDRGSGPFPTQTTETGLELLQVDADGRRIMVATESAYTAVVQGPIGVGVARGDEMAESPTDIAVTSGLQLLAIAPTQGMVGSTFELTGTGFDTRPGADVRVRFEELLVDAPNPQVFNATDVVVESSERIRAVVPAVPGSSATGWRVFVEQGPLTRRITSNREFFFLQAWIPAPSGLIVLRDTALPVEQATRIVFWLTPDGNAFAGGSQAGGWFGTNVGRWSVGGGALTIEGCVPPGMGSWYRFVGSIDFGGGDKACCLDGSFSCEPRPCAYVSGTYTLFVRDRPGDPIRQFDYSVDNRINPAGIPNQSSPRARDGFYPLPSRWDFSCPAQCFQFWNQPSPSLGTRPCTCSGCLP